MSQLANRQTKNHELDAPQLAKLNEVLQAGNSHELDFIKHSFSFGKLREIKSVQTNQILGAILQQASVLAGIKEGIQDVVKNDLKELIFNRFGGFSLEEIAHAFKLERQRVYETKTEHFQFFSTEYVAEILSKYKEYKRKKMCENNIEPPKELLPKKEASEEEKWQHFVEGLTADFQHFTEYKKLNFGITRHYKTLFRMGVLPTHNEAFREQITERTFRALQEDLERENNRNARKSIKRIIENQMTDEAKFRTKAQEIIIRDFFQQLVDNQQDITEIINRFGS